jgi:hypothetical protein
MLGKPGKANPPYRGGQLYVHAELRSTLPAILQLNQESRYCALEHYSPCFKPEFVRSPPLRFSDSNPSFTAEPIRQDFQHFFNSEHNYLRLDSAYPNPSSSLNYFDICSALDFTAQVKYLVLGIETFTHIIQEIRDRLSGVQRFQRFKIEAFSGLREIIVAGYDYHMPDCPEYVLTIERMRQHPLDIYPKEKVPKFRFVESKDTLAKELRK